MEFTVKVSFVEIYLERIRDLLDTSKTNLHVCAMLSLTSLACDMETGLSLEQLTKMLTTLEQVHEDPVTGVYIKDATEQYVTSEAEMLDVMKLGNENRTVAATGMNEGSSRSHSLFVITLVQKNSDTEEQKSGRFYLVDLAGSEMVRWLTLCTCVAVILTMRGAPTRSRKHQ